MRNNNFDTETGSSLNYSDSSDSMDISLNFCNHCKMYKIKFVNTFLEERYHENRQISPNQDTSNLEEAIKNNFNFNSKKIEKSDEKKKFFFNIEKCNPKRGRKGTGKGNRKMHGREAKDNIIIKIHINFLSFIINLNNDCINSLLKHKKIKFLKLDHSQIRKGFNQKILSEIKYLTIYELLSKMNISPKYTKSKIDSNKNNLEKLNEYSWFRNFIGQKYIELFKQYYNNKQPLKQIIIDNENVIVLKTAKSFYYLLNKKENIKITENIVKIAEEFFIDDINSKEGKDTNNSIE